MGGNFVWTGFHTAIVCMVLLMLTAAQAAAQSYMLPAGTVGERYSYQLEPEDGIPPYHFELVSGALPEGLSLSSSGLIFGTPTKSTFEGIAHFIIGITDSMNPRDDMPFVMEVNAIPPTMSGGSMTVEYGGTSTLDLAPLAGGEHYGDAHDFDIVEQPLGGHASIEGTTARYTARDGFSGDDSFTVRAYGPGGWSPSATITVAVQPPAPSAPIASDTTINTEYNGPAVEVNLAALTTGDFDSFEIVTQPEKGTLFENGMFVSYKPSEGETGADSFTWRAVGPGGASNIATVAVTINEAHATLPVAIDHVVALSPAESGSQDLTAGASGAPFLKAHLVGETSSETGAVSLNGTVMHFDPDAAFSGRARIGYQLENEAGRSNTAYVTFIVAARPDPSGDPEVVGLLTAHAEAARQLADDQITAISGRLESLHNEDACGRASSVDLKLGHAEPSRDPEDPGKDSVNLSGKSKSNCADWAVWGAGYVNLAEFDRGGVDFSSSGIGFTAGADYRFSPSFVGGVAIGYGHSHSDVGSNGTETIADAVSAALYASWHKNNWFLDGLVGYQHLRFESTRYVTANGEMAHGKRTGDQVFGAVTTGYEIRKDGVVISPYLGLRGSIGTLHGFTETGGGIYGLSYGDQKVSSLSGVVGVRVEKEIERDWGTLTPSARVEYRHAFADSSSVSIGYTDIGDLPHRAEIEGRGKDSVTVGVGLKAKPKKADGWTIEGTLSGTFGNGKPTASVGVRATYKFCGLFTPASKCGS